MSVIGTLVPGVKEEMIFRCIESLLETTADGPLNVRVTAIDNSPTPGLAGRLRARFPTIQVIENARRQGYAANHNMAMAGSDADYQLLCNDDLVFQPRTLERAVSYLEDPQNARVAVIAFQFLNPDGSLQHSTFAFPTVSRGLLGLSGLRAWVPFSDWTLGLAKILGRSEGRSRFWAHDRIVPVETFLGAAMLVRAIAAREVGPMDEVSLLGVEETEWHKRFWKRGWQIMFLPDAPIIHYGSQTLKVMPALETEELKGLLHYFRKHRSRLVVMVFSALGLPLVLLRALSCWVTGRPEEGAARRAAVRALVRGLVGAPVEPSPGAARS